jgi:hypothetical protein
MKTFQFFILFAVANFALQLISRAELVPLDKNIVSPDKAYAFKIKYYDRQYHFVIEDKNGKEVASIADEFGPILAVKWTDDSKAILVANHYARGKLLEVVHFDGQKWEVNEVPPPETRGYEYEVLDWKCKGDSVRLFFKVIIDSKTSPEAYKCSFDYNVLTGSTSNYSKSLISIDTYSATKSVLAPD